MRTLSTGQPSTLGSYLDNCKAFGFAKAAEHFEGQITKSPHGRDEEVIADESQVMLIIARLEKGK